jgi:hypothetical protein
MVQQEVRQYELQARSTETFGRVLCGARTHHFVGDGPLQNGCPGEAITPGELFLLVRVSTAKWIKCLEK